MQRAIQYYKFYYCEPYLKGANINTMYATYLHKKWAIGAVLVTALLMLYDTAAFTVEWPFGDGGYF
jgi:hypothetical protein